MDYVFVFIEVSALILFLIRIGHYSFNGGKAYSSGLILTGYMTLWILNILIHYLPWEVPSFYLSHAFKPTFIAFAILLEPKKKHLFDYCGNTSYRITYSVDFQHVLICWNLLPSYRTFACAMYKICSRE